MLQNDYSTNVPAANLLTTGVRDAFLADPAVVPTSANLTLSHIMLQKYIALFVHGAIETWVDMRRYHYVDNENGAQVYKDFVPPGTTVALWPDNLDKLVYRVRYRFNSEYLYNINELRSFGADKTDWHTVRTWFSEP